MEKRQKQAHAARKGGVAGGEDVYRPRVRAGQLYQKPRLILTLACAEINKLANAEINKLPLILTF